MSKSKEQNTESEDSSKRQIIFAVVILVFIILIYLISTGKINWLKNKEDDPDTKHLKFLESQLAKLHNKSKSKQDLKAKLDITVKIVFRITRAILATIYIGLNIIAYIWWIETETTFNEKISVLMNYNQIALILFLTFLFVRFDTHTDFKNVSRMIHLLVKKAVYRNHKGLELEIQIINQDISNLTSEKQKVEEKIAKAKTNQENQTDKKPSSITVKKITPK